MALLHDAPEYVVGDLISPFKAAIGIDYKDLELKLQAAIHLRFGLPAVVPPVLATLFKKADRLSAFYEATQLAGFEEAEARRTVRHPAQGAENAPADPPADRRGPGAVPGTISPARHKLSAKYEPCPASWSRPFPAWKTPLRATSPPISSPCCRPNT